MTQKKTTGLQSYPRREGEFLAEDGLFPKSDSITDEKLHQAIKSAFDRILTKKKGIKKSPEISPQKLVQICINHLKDTVGGQDIGGVFRRLESLGKEDKNLTRPYMGVFAIATPPKGYIASFENSRSMRYKQDGSLYSPNIEEWLPGFLFPYICGRLPQEVYKTALEYVSIYLPFNSLKYKDECSTLLVATLKKLDLIDEVNGRIDSVKFQRFLSSEGKT